MRAKNGKFYDDIANYIEMWNVMVEPNRDIKKVEYARSYVTGDSYIRLTDVFGGAFYFDVTAMNKESVLALMCNIICGIPTDKQVVDNNLKREIASMFD